MELPAHGGPTSVGDDGRFHRFPDPPPPPHARDADALQRDAALVRRRDELLWELHKEQIRLDMILRELVETEYAMAARSAPAAQWPMPTVPWSQDRWHRRASSVTTWEDAPLRRHPSTCHEHPPCYSRSPTAVKLPPVYPQVERSPSPIATSGYLEYCRSPSKQTFNEEAWVPGVTNAGVRPMGSEFFREEVAPEHKDAVGGERKAGLGEGVGIHPFFGSGNQSSGQRKTAEIAMMDLINEPGWHSSRCRPTDQENAAFKQQKRLEFSEPLPGSDAQQQQECRSSGATVHSMSNLELCQTPSKQTQAGKILMPMVSNTRPTQSASGEVAPRDRWDIGGESKHDMENGHGMPPLHKTGNQNSDQRKAEKSVMEAQINRPVQSPAGRGNAACNEQTGIELSEPRPDSDAKQQQECRSSGARDHPFSGYVELCRSPIKKTPVEILVPAAANGSAQLIRSESFCNEVASGHPQVFGGEPKVDWVNGQPLHEIKNESCGQRKVEESAMEGWIDKPLQPLQHSLAGQENAEYNEHKRIEFSEPTPERTSCGLKRRLTEATPPVKKPKPFKEWSCTLCQVNPTSQHNLDQHLAGRLHQSNLEALQARNKPAELNTKAAPGQWNSKNLTKDSESLRRDGKENIAENTGSRHLGEKPPVKGDVRQPSVKERLALTPSRWTCSLCQARCYTELDYYEHRRGRRHRENTEALCAEFRTQSERRDGDDGMTADWNWKRAFYCDVCDIQCNGEKMLASHLGGRRHREALEAARLE